MTDRCVFRLFTGLYCPGCGGRRALRALFHFGDVWRSFLIHPFVLYAVVIFSAFALSFAIHVVSGRKVAMLKFRMIYVWIGIVLILVNWIVKNIFLINGVDILKILTPLEYIL